MKISISTHKQLPKTATQVAVGDVFLNEDDIVCLRVDEGYVTLEESIYFSDEMFGDTEVIEVYGPLTIER